MARKKNSPGSMAVSTKAIHGVSTYAYQGPVAPPLVQTSTYRFANSGDAIRYAKGDPNIYVYSRYHNPTVREAQERIALMMNAESALLFSSGMAAITTAIFSAAKSGDHIISTPGLYGGTYRFFRDILPDHGIDVSYVHPDALRSIGALATPRTRIVYFETPTNPTLGIVDIKALVKETRRAETRLGTKIIIMCDNTFATILNQDPLSLGVDVVLESGTKYLGGHSDILAGVVVGTKKFVKGVHAQLKYFGGAADPFAAWLLLRSLKTFDLRVQRQNENALALARFLQRHRKIKRAIYPGLPSHPQHKIARQQMEGFGGVVTIEVKGGVRSAVKVSDSLKVAVNAMSLGSVETLVSIPVYSSHINMTKRELESHGVTPGMIRISVGVEDIDDLKRDFAAALGRI
ncbi:MAG: trans-sulfuration enzyme family protein [Bacteroidota bacterium]